jgi:hypothetical protein
MRAPAVEIVRWILFLGGLLCAVIAFRLHEASSTAGFFLFAAIAAPSLLLSCRSGPVWVIAFAVFIFTQLPRRAGASACWFFKAGHKEFWPVLLGIAVALWLGLVAALYFAIQPCPGASHSSYRYQCYADTVNETLSIWSFALVFLGPMLAFAYQARKVRARKRSALAGVAYAVTASVACNVVAIAVMFGAIALGQSFGLSLFSGDAALGLLGFAVLIVISLFLTGVFAIIMFVGAMANWPKRAKESGARDDGARNSP